MQKIKSERPLILQYGLQDVSITAIDTKYQGFFKLNQYQLSHKLFAQKQSATFPRAVFERGDAAVVMLYDPAQDKLLLLEQFRAGAIRSGETPWMLEFVAGMFNENERPVDVAVRETKEEANCSLAPADVQPIMHYLSSPGGMSERIHLYWARFDSKQVIPGSIYGLEDENEDILLHLITREQALALLNQGKISNAATVIGLQWLALNYQNL